MAAQLCNGVPLAELGEAIDPAELVPGVIPVPRQDDDEVVAEVLWVDHFGERAAQPRAGGRGRLGRRRPPPLGDEVRTATVVTTYDEIGPGAIGLVLDSYGLLAVSLMRRSAADELGLAQGRRSGCRRPAPDAARWADAARPPVALRPTDDSREPVRRPRPVRPATTLALALLLVAIVVAGVISLVMIG